MYGKVPKNCFVITKTYKPININNISVSKWLCLIYDNLTTIPNNITVSIQITDDRLVMFHNNNISQGFHYYLMRDSPPVGSRNKIMGRPVKSYYTMEMYL